MIRPPKVCDPLRSFPSRLTSLIACVLKSSVLVWLRSLRLIFSYLWESRKYLQPPDTFDSTFPLDRQRRHSAVFQTEPTARTNAGSFGWVGSAKTPTTVGKYCQVKNRIVDWRSGMRTSIFYWSLWPVASIAVKVRGIVCVVSTKVSFYSHRPCLERYRVSN